MRKISVPVLLLCLNSGQCWSATSASFTLTCAYEGDVNCNLGDDTDTFITKINDCNMLKNIQAPGVGKALLIKHNLLEKCDDRVVKKLRTDSKNCTREIEYVGENSDLLLYCSNNTNLQTKYESQQARLCLAQTSVENASSAIKVASDQYAICNGNNIKDCPVDARVKGADNLIYECTNGGWEKYEFVDTDVCREDVFKYPRTVYNLGSVSALLIADDRDAAYDGYVHVKVSGADTRSLRIANFCYMSDKDTYCSDQSKYHDYRYGTYGKLCSGTNTSDTKGVDITSGSVSNAIIASADPDVTYSNNGECENSGGVWNDEKKVCRCTGEGVKANLDPNPVVQPYMNQQNSETLYYSVCKCVAGYKRQDDKYTDDCIEADDTITEKVTDYEKMRQNAEDAYNAARDHEQSWANKGLTAASTLATGAGAMTALQAYAEQQADADAERDMAAYLATFKCEYGDGKTFNAGNEEITLPGGNELLGYYSEYKSLADNVKQTKTALGLRPGIESEVLYDRAQSGLYQYTNAARQSGGEISLARALTDSDSADAEKWNAQKEQTAQNLKTGTIAAAGGITAGIVGNRLINRNWKPSPLIEVLKPVITRVANEHTQTFEPITVVASEPEVTGDDSPQQPEYKQFSKLDIPVQNGVFKSGQLELTEQAKTDLTELVQSIKDSLKDPRYQKAELKISVDAYTDGQSLGPETKKRLNVKDNNDLSQARAAAILNQLKSSFNNDTITYEANGKGVHLDCQKDGKPVNASDDRCRKLSITVTDEHNYDDQAN